MLVYNKLLVSSQFHCTINKGSRNNLPYVIWHRKRSQNGRSRLCNRLTLIEVHVSKSWYTFVVFEKYVCVRPTRESVPTTGVLFWRITAGEWWLPASSFNFPPFDFYTHLVIYGRNWPNFFLNFFILFDILFTMSSTWT